MENNSELLKQVTEEMQKKCHKMCSLVVDANKSITYQDAANIFMFTTLADLTIRVMQIEKSNTIK